MGHQIESEQRRKIRSLVEATLGMVFVHLSVMVVGYEAMRVPLLP